MTGSEPEVLVETKGRLGHLVLNRPKAINALTLAMVDTMSEALEAWAEDDSVETVALTGAGDRGLCAGGDIRTLYDATTTGDLDHAETFWRREYALDALVAGYPKPYVAVMDGVVMGGGVGVSAHASHRIVTETTKVGMPEVTIGYTPDVGTSIILSHSPDELGTYAALTGIPLNATDAITVGLADTYVPSERIEELVRRLADEPADEAIAALTGGSPPESALDRTTIGRCFAHDTIAEIRGDLTRAGDRRTLEALDRAAPFSLAVTLRALRNARSFDRVEQSLEQDLTLSLALIRRPDFREGVRAAVIDKDRNPHWQPDSLADVAGADVDAVFQPDLNRKERR
ncbi:3-hydroxyisobutyryl-CoA hydrolase [Solicola gregarius]|uniref:3-hydroxyisobutyryl-CoA hydrolase n=1 Tax=Solicola gregarius TaxID=2908642 RepID=A0AA46YMS3_9ACTN|nr:3-hydroxyisobutyryl-CoA hydrolase [Solicola gregarius]UYM06013.1 3-hydroxyisobutyryl-CoA hydrolase [Solicola gregarius]